MGTTKTLFPMGQCRKEGKMEKFIIMPQSTDLSDREAETHEDAMLNFAETMDSDMNTYVKAVHEDDFANELTNFIVKAIDNIKLSTSQCSDIFRAIKRQDEVLGGKLWTTEDIDKVVEEEFGGEDALALTQEQKDVVLGEIECLRDNPLDDADDAEWNTIKNAIIESGLTITVTDIDWDVDEDEFEDEAEFFAVVENLPSTVDIPLVDLEETEIVDWLSDNYEYCVNSYKVQVDSGKEESEVVA